MKLEIISVITRFFELACLPLGEKKFVKFRTETVYWQEQEAAEVLLPSDIFLSRCIHLMLLPSSTSSSASVRLIFPPYPSKKGTEKCNGFCGVGVACYEKHSICQKYRIEKKRETL